MLKLWKSGFSLDEGELRNYSDPGNALFLESIRRGWVSLAGHFLSRCRDELSIILPQAVLV